MKLIDLTHTFTDDMPIFPGDPKSELKQIAEISKDGFVDHEIKSSMHVGTHMDAPWHMIKNGKKLSDVNPENFFGYGVLIDARGHKEVDVELLDGIDIQAGDIVLVMSGFYKKYREKEYYENYPEISMGFAKKLIDLKIKIVGMDIPSPDRSPFKIHKLLLAEEILIIENLTNLEDLLSVTKFEVVALPAKFDTEASITRVIAKI